MHLLHGRPGSTSSQFLIVIRTARGPSKKTVTAKLLPEAASIQVSDRRTTFWPDIMPFAIARQNSRQYQLWESQNFLALLGLPYRSAM